MSSRRKSVSGSAMRVAKRKLTPPPAPSSSLLATEPSHTDQEPLFSSPSRPSKRRLSALGGPARVRTPSKASSHDCHCEDDKIDDKENCLNDGGDKKRSDIFRFCRDRLSGGNDGNASDEFSRDSLETGNNSSSSSSSRRGSTDSSERRSSTSSHDSASTLSSGEDMTHRLWTSKDFSIGKAIGKGKFGNVYLAKVKKHRTAVALKVLFKAPMRAANCVHSLRREVEIQCRLKHKNITQLFGYFHDSKNVYLILQYLQQGELFKYLDRHGGSVDEATCKEFMCDVLSAVSYLHIHKVAHRDLKPENVLYDIDESGKMNLRIADFGCAVILSPLEEKTTDLLTTCGPFAKQLTVCGTPEYLAPEMLLEVGHGLEVDLWALGVFIFELITGKTPFASKQAKKSGSDGDNYSISSSSATYDNIKQHHGSLFPLLDAKKDCLFSVELKDIVDKWLNTVPEKRPAVDEMISLPFWTAR